MRIKAAVMDRTHRVLGADEATALGAAILGGLGAGVYPNVESALSASATRGRRSNRLRSTPPSTTRSSRGSTGGSTRRSPRSATPSSICRANGHERALPRPRSRHLVGQGAGGGRCGSGPRRRRRGISGPPSPARLGRARPRHLVDGDDRGGAASGRLARPGSPHRRHRRLGANARHGPPRRTRAAPRAGHHLGRRPFASASRADHASGRRGTVDRHRRQSARRRLSGGDDRLVERRAIVPLVADETGPLAERRIAPPPHRRDRHRSGRRQRHAVARRALARLVSPICWRRSASSRPNCRRCGHRPRARAPSGPTPRPNSGCRRASRLSSAPAMRRAACLARGSSIRRRCCCRSAPAPR